MWTEFLRLWLAALLFAIVLMALLSVPWLLVCLNPRTELQPLE